MPSPWTATARSLSRAREDLASFRPPPVRNTGRKDPHCRCAGPFWLPCRRQRQRGYHLSDKRNRGSVSTFDRSLVPLTASLAHSSHARVRRNPHHVVTRVGSKGWSVLILLRQ